MPDPSDVGRPSDVELGKRNSPRGKTSDKNSNKPSKKSQVASEQSIQAPKAPWNINIRINADVKNTKGLSNKVVTTKYSILTWLPKSLFEQFRRVANCYFLFVSILMLIGTYATFLFQTPLSPWSTIATLAFVLLVTSTKEGYEDYYRYKSDSHENMRKVTVVSFDEEGDIFTKEILCQNVKAGDIIKMTGKTQVPADLLLIYTSNHADGNQCYCETMSIDGETNLKLREAPALLKEYVKIGNESELTGPLDLKLHQLFRGTLEYEPPNKNIHNFIGKLELTDVDEGRAIPLSADNVLLRSSIFANTEWAYGIALYTGQESKIQMNNRRVISKMSKLEKYLNLAILLIFCVQILFVIASIGSIYLLGYNNVSQFPYVYPSGSNTTIIIPLWVSQFPVFLLLYNNLIPISIYVTIEIVNLGQAFMVGSDHEMYDEVLDVPCTVKSSNLCQELGMVSNIFSDKTGTLTRNEMKFVRFVVDEAVYMVPQDNSFISVNSPGSSPLFDKSVPQPSGSGKTADTAHGPTAEEVIALARNPSSKIGDFLLCLTTCHTVIRESDGTFRAESPDELALVQGVEPFSCGIDQRSTSGMIVNYLGEKASFDVLAVNAFNADRKRMSLLLRRPLPDGTSQYVLMCKGADNIMLPLCDLGDQQRRSIDKALLDFASEGLRTLCVAQKIIPEEYFKTWFERYNNAGASMTQRSELLAEVAADIELNMTLLGITAIEDRLQDQVPEVIAEIADAGITTWMLTGDKEETAVNIGLSCNLVLPQMKQFSVCKIESAEEYEDRLMQCYNQIVPPSERILNRRYEDDEEDEEAGVKNDRDDDDVENISSEIVEKKQYVLVMDGPSFKYFDESSVNQKKMLLALGKGSRSVIACRLTPVQKQMLVALVKNDPTCSPRAITLAIGDGANDVSMVREANVGIGIFGKEGRQAANNSDFAIGQFKFLRRLLFIHGRLNYCRQSRVFLYSMFKNMVITLTLFWYNYFTAMSGTSFYESWIYSSYNFVLGLPIIFYGFMDRDISFEFALLNPQTYSTGMENIYLLPKTILWWIFNAIVYAIIVSLMYYYVLFNSLRTYSVYEAGTLVFSGLCLTMTTKVILMHHIWTRLQVLLIFISLAGMLIFFLIMSASTYDFVGVANNLYSRGIYWVYGIFTIVFFAPMWDVTVYYLVSFFRPTREMIFREIENESAKFSLHQERRRRSSAALGQSRERMTDGGQGGQSVTTLIGSQTKSSIKLGGGSYLVNPFKSSGKYVGDSVLSNVSNPVHHQGAASVDEDVSVGVIQGGAVVANRSISNNSSDNSSVAKEVEPSLLIKQNLFELEVEILEVQTKAVEEGEKMENESEVSKEAVNEESLQFPENGTTDLLDVNNTE